MLALEIYILLTDKIIGQLDEVWLQDVTPGTKMAESKHEEDGNKENLDLSIRHPHCHLYQ